MSMEMPVSELFCEFVESPVGPIRIDADAIGVRAVTLGASPEQTTALSPNAITSECAEQLSEYFAGLRQVFTVPLSLQGTEFELRVWSELQRVAFGDTCSYLDIANRLENPAAIRAVGRANGRNPVGIIVPCHRVIGKSGGLTGYAGELWRKRWLLDHEARTIGTLLL